MAVQLGVTPPTITFAVGCVLRRMTTIGVDVSIRHSMRIVDALNATHAALSAYLFSGALRTQSLFAGSIKAVEPGGRYLGLTLLAFRAAVLSAQSENIEGWTMQAEYHALAVYFILFLFVSIRTEKRCSQRAVTCNISESAVLVVVGDLLPSREGVTGVGPGS